MRRRRPPERPAEGVIGLFRRTPEAWRALGAPPSLWDEAEAAAAWRRCALPAFSGLVVVEDQAPGGTRFLARRWWTVAAPYFLHTVGALTAAERGELEHRPGLPGLGYTVDQDSADRELFTTRAQPEGSGRDTRLWSDRPVRRVRGS